MRYVVVVQGEASEPAWRVEREPRGVQLEQAYPQRGRPCQGRDEDGRQGSARRELHYNGFTLPMHVLRLTLLLLMCS